MKSYYLIVIKLFLPSNQQQKLSIMYQQEQTTKIFEHKPQKYHIYSSRGQQSISFLEIFKETLKIEHLNRDISWKNILAIDACDQQNALVEIKLTLFFKQKKWFKGIVRCEEVIQFFIMPEHVKKLILDVRRFMTQSQIDNPKFLIFHNPASGSDSKSKLMRGIQFIKKTHFDFELVTTQEQNHCKEYIKEHKPSEKQFWGVAIFSGDGLMHEFVNSGCTIPVIHCPAGSANAFAKNQAVLANEECSVQTNLFIAMKGLTTKISLLELQLEKIPHKLRSMLNLDWAFLADVNVVSEFLRCLGTLRFEVCSFWKFFFLRTYHGKVTFSETSTDLPDLSQPITNPQFQTLETDFYNFIIQLMPYVGQKYNCAPLIEVNSPVLDLQSVTVENGRFAFLKYLLNFKSGGNFDLKNKKAKQNFQHNLVKSFRLQPTGQRLGRFGIDGEDFEAQKVQGKIILDALKVFTLY